MKKFIGVFLAIWVPIGIYWLGDGEFTRGPSLGFLGYIIVAAVIFVIYLMPKDKQ